MRVGVSLDHGLCSVIGHLGVLKAGKVCVFLDRTGPAERTRTIVENAGLGCVISDESGFASLGELGFGLEQIITLDECNNQPAANPELKICPTASADITYSSGSTGFPKGIVHSHRNRLHNAWNGTNALQICPHDRITFLHSSTSGPAPSDTHLALMNGAALCSFDISRMNMSALAAWLEDEAITILHWVPSLFRCFGTTLQAGDRFSQVRLVVLGSEQATTHDLELMKRHFSDSCGFVHRLGAIETLNTRLFVTNAQTDLPTGGLPAGYQLPDQKLLLVDKSGQPVPLGEIGEVIICSEWLALEYFRQPELTAAAFFTNPIDGARCFRTGDLGRLDQSGCLEYLGRANSFAKVRGQWVDTAKIEALLAEQPQLAEYAAVVRDDELSGSLLTVFLVPASNTIPSVAKIRSLLLRSLPFEQLPSQFFTLARMPRLASGKLDRRLLSQGTLAAVREACGTVEELIEAATFVAPASDVERSLATIWEDVFDIRPLGVYESFFDLGGDSLRAMRIVVMVNLNFKCELSPASVFSAPTIAQFAQVVTQATTEAFPPLSAALRPRTVQQRIPLSFGQQRLWFLEQMEGKLTAYNMPYTWQLRGPLHPEALRRALETIVQRHEPLRSTFALVDGEPIQVIRDFEHFALPLEDLRGFGPEAQAAAVANRRREEADRPFDLTCDLMLRSSLLRLADEEHTLLLTLHHIAADGWSVRVLWRELTLLYDSFCRGIDPDRPALAVQYADFAVWQRQQLQGRRFERLLSYWRGQLAGLTALELPTDRPRPRHASHRGAQHDFSLDSELVRQLQSLGQIESVTLHMTLLAAFQTLLARYSGQDDIAVGTPIAGRNHVELAELIGFFVNMLVLRTDLSGNPTFLALLARVRQVSLSAYDHQDLPFEKLVEALQPERHQNCNPLIQVVFQLLSFPDQGLSLRELEASRLSQSVGRVRFDLEMYLWQPAECTEDLQGSILYNMDLFDADTIQRLAEHFVTLLRAIVARPDAPIDRLPLMADAERQLVVETWNQTKRNYPQLCVSRLFELQADRRPDAVAVTCGDVHLTYEQLNRRANRLARQLRQLGVGRETRVGISVNRSFDMLVGLLAILKAGAAYVPLDPHYPDERLSFFLADTDTILILTQRNLERRWQHFGVRLLFLDDEQPAWRGHMDNLNEDVSLDSLAYITYTSGSTGVPKGVEVLHRGIVRLLFGGDYVELDETQSVLQLATLSFDASTFEIWAPLLHGGRCVLAPPGFPDFDELQRLIRREHVRTVWLTSTLFNAIVDTQTDVLQGVEQLLVGGEALSVPHIRRAQQALGTGTQIINGYGPTESTTFACCYRLPAQWMDPRRSIPIGRPIANTTAYVLFPNGEPAPIGVPGELYLGGDGLARGYLNQPELTAEKFVPDSLHDRPTARLYRTGDRARWLRDGTLEFLGRFDAQVKLRGYRVELGEIESVLMQHGPFKQVAVVLREDRPGDKRLVAYCVPDSSQSLPTSSELKMLLHGHLPDYMIPSAFVLINSLPRNANGKIEKRELPLPVDDATTFDRADDAPRTAEEQWIASVWCSLLGRDHVDLNDSFFNLGGHSLLALRMVDAVNQRLAGQLKVVDVFVHPTVSALAQRLVSSRQTRQQPSSGRYLEVIRSGGQSTTIVGVGTNLQAMVKGLPDETPVWWLMLDGVHVWPHLNLSISDQASIDVAELERAQLTDELILFGFSYGGLLALEIARQLTQRGRRNISLVLLEPSLPGNQKPGFADRVSRHLRVLSEPRATGRATYVGTRLRNVINAKWHAWRTRCQRFLAIDIPVEQRWSYMEPFLIRQTRAYTLSARLPLDVHLIARPEALKSCQIALQDLVGGKLITHTMPEHLTHVETGELEHSQVLGDVIRQLVAGEPSIP